MDNAFMKRQEIIRELRKILSESGISQAYLFGSFARGEKKFNDLDIAITPPEHFSLLDLSRLANRIEERTGIGADVVTLRAMHPEIRKNAAKEMVPV